MKHPNQIALFFFLMVYSGLIFAQIEAPSSEDFVIYNPHSFVNVDLPKFSTISKRGNTSVDKNTGGLSLSYTLQTIQCGSNYLNVTANYSASGVRPTEYASEIGLGWNIGVGASISRAMNGVPDELPNGYWNTGPIPNELSDDYLLNVIKGQVDTKPDIFKYSLPTGESGSFIIGKNSEVYQVPVQDVIIEYRIINNSLSFSITNKLGHIYIFKEHESIQIQESSLGDEISYLYPTNWLLTKIDYPDTPHDILIEYQSDCSIFKDWVDSTSLKQSISITEVDQWNCASDMPPPSVAYNSSNTYELSSKKYIKTIQTDYKCTKLEFVYSENTRLDDQLYLGNGCKILKKIKKVVVCNSEQEVITTEVGTDYFSGEKRLRLDKITYGAGSSDEETIHFSYFDHLIPSHNTLGIDYWGYYNGYEDNKGLIPFEVLDVMPNISGINYNGSYFGNRSFTTDSIYYEIGLINGIVEPNGNNISIEYEPNDYGYIGNTSINEQDTEVFFGDLSCTSNCINTVNILISENTTLKLYYDIFEVNDQIPDEGVYKFFVNNDLIIDETLPTTNPQIDFVELQPGSHQLKLINNNPSSTINFDLQYEYSQPTDYIVNKTGGGVRVRKIIEEGHGLSEERIYDYRMQNNEEKSSGVLTTNNWTINKNVTPKYHECSNVGGIPDNGISEMMQTLVFSGRNAPTAPLLDKYIYYKEVTVRVINTDGEYEKMAKYDVPDGYYTNSNGVYPPISYAYKDARDSKTFDEIGEMINHSESIFELSEYGVGLPVLLVEITKSANFEENMEFQFWTFDIKSSLFRLNASLNSEKLSGGDMLNYTTAYTYKPNSNIISSKTISGLNDTRQVNLKYITDVVGGPTCMDIGGRNMIGVPIEIDISGDMMKRQKIDFLCSGDGLVLPYKISSYNYDDNDWALPDIKITKYNVNGKPSESVLKGYSNNKSIVYSWHNQMLEEIDFLGRKSIYTYNDKNQILSYEDLNGIITEYGFDGQERLKFEKIAGKSQTDYDYSTVQSGGENKVSVDITFENDFYDLSGHNIYNGRGQVLTSKKDGFLNKNIQYDGFGRAISEKGYTQSYVNVNEYAPGPSNNIIRSFVQTWPKSRYHELKIVDNSLVSISKDENNYITKTFMNLFGRKEKVVKFIDTEVVETLFDYDNRGNVKQITNPIGEIYSYIYDGENKLTQKTIPHEGVFIYEYNDKDWLTKEITPHATFDYVYNDFGEVIETYIDGLLSIENIYGDAGNENGKIINKNVLLLGTDNFINYTYNYDEPFGRLNREIVMNPWGSDTYDYEYDDVDNIKSVSRSSVINGQTINIVDEFDYDMYSRLAKHDQKIGSSSFNFLYGKSYNSIGQVTGMGLGNSVSLPLESVSYSYNSRDWISSINSGCEECVEVKEEVFAAFDGDIDINTKLEFFLNAVNVIAKEPTQAKLIYKAEFLHSDSIVYYESDSITINLNGDQGDAIYPDTILIEATGNVSNQALSEELIHEIHQLFDRDGRYPGYDPEDNPNVLTPVIPEVIDDVKVDYDCEFESSILFSQNIGYINPLSDEGFNDGKEEYTGNINTISYCTVGRQGTDVYGFVYDELGRITDSYYPKSFSNDKHDFDVTIKYEDKIGNIDRITRRGLVHIDEDTGDLTYGVMDNLKFSYSNGVLSNIEEEGIVDYGFRGNGGAFVYNNGKIVSGPGISSVGYNPIALPESINSVDGDIVEIVYDAEGNKWHQDKKWGVVPPEPYTTSPEGKEVKIINRGLEYINNDFMVYNFEHGRAIIVGGQLESYEFYLKDHLGNIRVVFTDFNDDGEIDPDPNGNEILETYSYYPFGMEMEGVDAVRQAPIYQPHGYNGKERLLDNTYDYGARMYMSAIGRWNAVDPLAEEMPAWSPYNYVFNNPILLIDPDGLAPANVDWIDNKDGTYTAEDGDSAWTLSQQTGITFERAKEIMKSQGMPTYIDPSDEVEKSALDPGDIVTIPESRQQFIDNLSSFIKRQESINSLENKLITVDRKIDSFQADINRTYSTMKPSKGEDRFRSGEGGFILGMSIKMQKLEVGRDSNISKKEKLQDSLKVLKKDSDGN